MHEHIATAPRLIALTDQASYPDCLSHAEVLCEQALGRTVAVVLRDRELSVRERLSSAESLRRVTSDHKQYLYISDRVDLARIVAADGVHLPASGFRPSACREIWAGPISRAGHDLETLDEDDWASLEHILVSPVAEARKGREPLGEDGFARARDAIRSKSEHTCIYALGGVTATTAKSYIQAGARGVAAIGAVWESTQRVALLDALGIRRMT